MAGVEVTSGRPHVELRDVTKQFGGVRALDSVSLTIARGSVHALVGENGAGKSTLGKIVAGIHSADAGEILLDGEPIVLRSPREALSRGIAAIAQEPQIVPQLTVAENVLLGSEPRRAGLIERRALGRRFRALAEEAGFADLDGDAVSGALRTAEQQKVEILRALSRDAQVMIMDEPAAALNRLETEHLHDRIRALAARGTTVVLISHFLEEVLALADVVTVLRDGRIVRTAPTAGETRDSLIEAMLGRPLDAAFPPRRPVPADAGVVLRVRDLDAPGVAGASLELRAGEILGLAGLVGAGRTELARALMGAERAEAGVVELNGAELSGGPRVRLRAGLGMIPESRKDNGLIMGRSVSENVSLSRLRELGRAGIVSRREERRRVGEVLERCDVRAAGQSQPVGTLSGGNQQKVLFARVLLCGPAVVIADEPTRGVDVGAKRAIYDILVDLAARGHGVLLISSELEEILGLAHRVLVMRRGRIVREVTGEDINEATILGAAFAGAQDTQEASVSETAVVETEVAPPDPPGPPPGSLSARLHGMSVARLREYGILLPFVGLFVTLSLASGPFFTKVNLLNILDQQSGTMVVAAAGTLVVIAGGIDLSVGATYSLGGVVAAELCEHGHSPGLSIVLGILAGFGVGLLNGLLVTIGKINALIATLAMAFVIGGLASLVTKGNLVVLQDRPNFAKFTTTEFLGVKSSTWIMILCVAAIGVLLARSIAGRYMYAAGGNAEAARLAGVTVDRVRVLTFALSGGAAGLAGVMDSSRALSAQATNGDATLAFTVLAGIVVGGTSILGGAGRGLAHGRRHPLHRPDRQRLHPAGPGPALRADDPRRVAAGRRGARRLGAAGRSGAARVSCPRASGSRGRRRGAGSDRASAG